MPGGDRAARKFGLRAVLTGLVLLTVILTAVLIHLTWFYAARRNVADVVGQLNRQIVGSVQHEVRGTLNEAWSVQEAVRSIFFQEAIKPTDEAKREFIFLALLPNSRFGVLLHLDHVDLVVGRSERAEEGSVGKAESDPR